MKTPGSDTSSSFGAEKEGQQRSSDMPRGPTFFHLRKTSLKVTPPELQELSNAEAETEMIRRQSNNDLEPSMKIQKKNKAHFFVQA